MLPPPPLRTVHATFTAHGSSHYKRPKTGRGFRTVIPRQWTCLWQVGWSKTRFQNHYQTQQENSKTASTQAQRCDPQTPGQLASRIGCGDQPRYPGLGQLLSYLFRKRHLLQHGLPGVSETLSLGCFPPPQQERWLALPMILAAGQRHYRFL